MIRSMTGYGSYEEMSDVCLQHWEIKSVNSKNLNVRFKIPSYLRGAEHLFLKEVKNEATRGNIEIYLGLKIIKKELLPFQINESLLSMLFDFLDEYAKKRGEVFVPDYNFVFSIPGLWSETAVDISLELVDTLRKGLKEALNRWNEFREREGKNLVDDVRGRLDKLFEIKNNIEKITSRLVEEKFEVLKNRIREFTEKIDIELDEDRLLQELAIMADKLDVSEELVRLNSHLKAMNGLLESHGPVGRQLDFLCQECFREINTCGNKAQNADISTFVVEFKTELERCREQIQNLE